MGFFFIEDEKPAAVRKLIKTTGGYSNEMLQQKKCEVCSLNKLPHIQSPYMKPIGSNKPLIYMLGSAPDFHDDYEDRPFCGTKREILDLRIPRQWRSSLRWNNTVNCRPPDDRDPSHVETTCCRPFIVEDIEATQPVAIFGFGGVPLHWAIGQRDISRWSGRRVPVQIGQHKCWYYAFTDPETIRFRRKFQPRNSGSYGCEDEFALAVHLQRAFDQVADGLPEPVIHTPEDARSNITTITGAGRDDLDRVIDFFDRTDDDDGIWVGMDYEANALRPYNRSAKLLTCSLSMFDENMAFALDHLQAKWSDRQRRLLDEEFGRWLKHGRCRKISFSTYEMEWSAVKYGEESLNTLWGDAQSQAYLLDGRSGMLSLDKLCLQRFGFNLKVLSAVDRANLDEEPLDDVLHYNGMDSKYHLALFDVQNADIEDQELAEVYEHQMRRVPTVILTQMKGVPIDQSRVEALNKKYADRIKDVEDQLSRLHVMKQFKAMSKTPYRPNAERDVRTIFGLLGVRGDALAKIDENSINALRDDNDDPSEVSEISELARLTIEWRKASKVLSTYIEPCLPGHEKTVVHDDGMLHPIIALHKTTTWRTSSESPNAQNYPKRNEDTKEVRGIVNAAAITSGPYTYKQSSPVKIVSFDYAGIQARNVAMESLDRTLIKFFHERYDIHKDWMLRIAKRCPYWADGKRLASDKTYAKHHRYLAKNKFVFPTFFGARYTTLATKHLHIDEKDAEWLQGEFKDLFNGVDRWHGDVHAQYERDGYVTGLSGFRRYAPVDMNERINTPIQGDEAIIVCDAYARLSEYAREREEWQYQATLEIHDDLTFIWPKNKIEEYSQVVIEHMLFVPFEWAHVVPIEVEMSVGDDWADVKEVGAFASDTWKNNGVGYETIK